MALAENFLAQFTLFNGKFSRMLKQSLALFLSFGIAGYSGAETIISEQANTVQNVSTGGISSLDLSIFGMYQQADIVVKSVMIGLIVISVITWTILFAKSIALLRAKKQLRREYRLLFPSNSLSTACELSQSFAENSISAALLRDAQDEKQLSTHASDLNGIKDRTNFRLDRRVAAYGRQLAKGNGYLATIGAVAPFIGLFGTVWGIMNSFIGIAHSQTTNLAVVAPGIAEALLATAMGLIAAIPAVVIYNLFSRMINEHRAQVGDAAAQILLLLSRDLDLNAPQQQVG
ncbi:tonB-system energizer ExbB [Hafnia alvei]|uniref:tonB-system energizer ExbB n=1 Tax=Hafnia alvei TaxID=569 RepID=UPI000DFB62C8|nr:tonB-system energizer ExbB [Hafnia alvei]STQ74128.1 Biopolymer transport protein exbB [Hafnia alvei]